MPLIILLSFFHILLGARGENGEPGVVFDAPRKPPPPIDDSEFKDEIVKGGSEVMDAVTNDEAKVGGRLVEHFDPRELVEVINIEIRPSSVRAFFVPGSNFGFKALQVVERPVEPPFVVESHD
jgi:hypothetical protein